MISRDPVYPRATRWWALWLVVLLGGCALLLAGCGSLQESYVEADRATYEAIAPEYEVYVELDAGLTPPEIERRVRLIRSWKARIDEGYRALKVEGEE